MRRYVLFLAAGVALAALVFALTRDRINHKDPMSVARAYFAHLRDGQVDEAGKLAWFESDRARREWEKQAQSYVQHLNDDGRRWWGDPFKVERWAVVDGERAMIWAQWLPRGSEVENWSPPDYAYRMRTVNGKWRMAIDEETLDEGVPFVVTR